MAQPFNPDLGSLDPIPSNAYNQTTHNKGTFTPRANMYNDPQGLNGPAVESSVGPQLFQRAMNVKLARERVPHLRFSLLSGTRTLDKHNGKQISATYYYPLLDPRNINDQGINSEGVQTKHGNLYQGSRSIPDIVGQKPVLSEIGGRVNRVGIHRTQIFATLSDLGFFMEYTRDARDFDSDPGLIAEMMSQMNETAVKIYEDVLAIDLLNGAGTQVWLGSSTSLDTVDNSAVVDTRDLAALNTLLKAVRSPATTHILDGTSKVDTRTVSYKRIMYVGTEVVNHLKTLTELNSTDRAFIPVEKYAAGVKVLEGEAGIIEGFRIVEIDEMLYWGSSGADNAATGFLSDDGAKYNVYPMITIGSDAFSTIGVRGDKKFLWYHIPPEKNVNPWHDPYGRTGMISVQFRSGTIITRPERIGLIMTALPA